MTESIRQYRRILSDSVVLSIPVSLPVSFIKEDGVGGSDGGIPTPSLEYTGSSCVHRYQTLGPLEGPIGPLPLGSILDSTVTSESFGVTDTLDFILGSTDLLGQLDWVLLLFVGRS